MIVYFPGDGSERCCICGFRAPEESLYVGRSGVLTDEGLPERFPVCSVYHGDIFISLYVARGEPEVP